jgi:organic hydroperoxide reductase OsmC/OhrA
MTRAREYTFPVSLAGIDRRRVQAVVDAKPPLEIATPPEFHGEFPDVWSPEDLLVAATASCFALTLDAVVERMDAVIVARSIEGKGCVGRRDDGSFGFVAIRLDVVLETESAAEVAKQAAKTAEERCIVSTALNVPVDVEVVVRSRVVGTERSVLA